MIGRPFCCEGRDKRSVPRLLHAGNIQIAAANEAADLFAVVGGLHIVPGLAVVIGIQVGHLAAGSQRADAGIAAGGIIRQALAGHQRGGQAVEAELLAAADALLHILLADVAHAHGAVVGFIHHQQPAVLPASGVDVAVGAHRRLTVGAAPGGRAGRGVHGQLHPCLGVDIAEAGQRIEAGRIIAPYGFAAGVGGVHGAHVGADLLHQLLVGPFGFVQRLVAGLVILAVYGLVPGHGAEVLVVLAVGEEHVAVAGKDLVEDVAQGLVIPLPELFLGEQAGVAVRDEIAALGQGAQRQHQYAKKDAEQADHVLFHVGRPP